MPDVTGQPRMLAETLVRKAGLRYRVHLEETADKPDGTVLRQEPAAGTAVPLESRVKLIVAKRPAARGLSVPDVVGKPLDEATKALRAAGFLVRIEGSATTGTVVAQDPPAGAEAPKRSWVILTLGR